MVCWDLITSVHLSLDATESGLGNKCHSARTSVANWVVTVVSHLHRGGFDYLTGAPGSNRPKVGTRKSSREVKVLA